jgi:hypothetical protein
MTEDAIDFERAEMPEEAAEAPSCRICGTAIGTSYYEIAGRMSCPGCNQRLSAELTRAFSIRTFFRALMFGGGAAIGGSIVWYYFGKLTGYNLSLIAIAIGIVIGLAIRKATGGIGGKRYQALAMFLTYSAIVWTNVPRILDELANRPPPAEVQPGAQSSVGVAPVPSATSQPPVQREPPPPVTLKQFLFAWLVLFAFAYAVPFLGGAKSILSVIIIGIGLYEAWKFTKGTPIPIKGPFTRDGG